MDERRTVTVMDGDRFVGMADCRVIRFGDGRTGVVWRGLAFPLEAQDCIDVSREGLSPSVATSPVAAAPRRTFIVIPGEEEGVLLIAGDATVRDLAISQLSQAGVMVLRHGRWLGDPVDDLEADWFVRFVHPVGDGLATSIDGYLQLPAEKTSPPDVLRLRLLDAALAQARANAAELRRQLVSLQDRLAPPIPADMDGMSALQAELEVEREARIAAERALAQIGVPRELSAAAESEPSAVTEGAPHRPVKARRSLQSEVQTVFDRLLPALRPLRDSLSIAAGEFRDRGSLYRCLAELAGAGGRTPPGWKKLQGVEPWWERHVSTGEDDAGRIYARLDGKNRVWCFLLSHKGQQERDFAWLQRNANG